jgi:hypothetical protein
MEHPAFMKPTSPASFVVVVDRQSRQPIGRYLKGPRPPAQVRRDGYGFTSDLAEAWTFPSEKQAAAKARIVDRHMGWEANTLIPQPITSTL